MRHERKKNGYKAMNEMKTGNYTPEIDEMEKERQWHEPKFPCKFCKKEFCVTTLKKFKGACCRCDRKHKDKTGGHQTEENATDYGFVEFATSNLSDSDSDDESESEEEKTETKAKGAESDSSDDSDYEGDTDEEEGEKPKPKTKPRRSKRRVSTEKEKEDKHKHVADDTNFVVGDDFVEAEYKREDKRPPRNELEEEAADLAHYTSLIQDKPKSAKRRGDSPPVAAAEDEDKHAHGPDEQPTKESKRKRRRVVVSDDEQEETKDDQPDAAPAAVPAKEKKKEGWREDAEDLADIAAVALDSIIWKVKTPTQLVKDTKVVRIRLDELDAFLKAVRTRVI